VHAHALKAGLLASTHAPRMPKLHLNRLWLKLGFRSSVRCALKSHSPSTTLGRPLVSPGVAGCQVQGGPTLLGLRAGPKCPGGPIRLVYTFEHASEQSKYSKSQAEQFRAAIVN
jgi:hypothetical protein